MISYPRIFFVCAELHEERRKFALIILKNKVVITGVYLLKFNNTKGIHTAMDI